ncbi:MAG: PilZ domain-containing protein [Desulfobacterales bacterium]|nr:PilZ domain-containing protein [Desulfobacterales bacterium]
MKQIDIQKRLIEIILNMTEEQQVKLLQLLEKKPIKEPLPISTVEKAVAVEKAPEKQDTMKQSQGEKRRHPRKDVTLDAVIATEDRVYWDTILNISAGGVFIETENPLDIGQEVSLAFSPFSFDDTIRIEGEIVRIDKNGFSVRFSRSIQDFMKRYRKANM